MNLPCKISNTGAPVALEFFQYSLIEVIKAPLLDREQLDYDVLCFVLLTIRPHTQEIIEMIKSAICQSVIVLECYALSGRADMILKIVVENHHALHQFVGQFTELEGIDRIETAIVLQQVKLTTELSLE